MKKTVLCLAFTLISTFFVTAADTDPREVLETARRQYAEEHYDSTIATIRGFLKDNGTDPSTEYLVPLLMEALAREGKYDQFAKTAKLFLRRFPNSKFVPRVAYLEGMVLTRTERYRDAVIAFSQALKAGVRGDLDSLSITNVDKITRKALREEDLNELVRNSDLHPRIREILAFAVFTKTKETGNREKAEVIAEEFLSTYPKSRYGGRVRAFLKPAEQLTVGLLAPLSGEDSLIGQNMKRAVELAIDRHNENSYPPIKLLVRNTEGKMIETARATKELLAQKVPIILGPALSSNAIVTASMVMGTNSVMITPTATEEGIAGLGKNVFQVNVTMGMLGRRIARYAMENLNIKEFAILAPMSEYGNVLARSFQSEVKESGGEIILKEYFDEGANDLRTQMLSLKMKLVSERLKKEAEEKGEDPSEVHLTSQDTLMWEDSTVRVGGLFVPAEAGDAVTVARQVSFYLIRTQLLGSTGWQDNVVLLDGKQYVNDALISTSFDFDVRKESWQDFSTKFRAKYNTDPDRVAAPLTYDAATLMTAAVAALGGEVSTDAIIEYLLDVKDYQGISGTITFRGNDGANTETAIKKIKDKSFVRVQ